MEKSGKFMMRTCNNAFLEQKIILFKMTLRLTDKHLYCMITIKGARTIENYAIFSHKSKQTSAVTLINFVHVKSTYYERTLVEFQLITFSASNWSN